MFGSWGCLTTRKHAGIVAFAVLAAFPVVLRAFWGSFGLIPAAVQSVAGGGPDCGRPRRTLAEDVSRAGRTRFLLEIDIWGKTGPRA